MSVAALRAETACWDVSLLGRACEPLEEGPAGTGPNPCFFDLWDIARTRPWKVSKHYVRRAAESSDCNIWRVTTQVLPACAHTPLRIASTLEVKSELRPTCGLSINQEPPLGPETAREVLQSRLLHLLPATGTTLSLRWCEPTVRVALPSDGRANRPAYVSNLVFGPTVAIKVARTKAGSLQILSVEDGPEGLDRGTLGRSLPELLEEQRSRSQDQSNKQTESVHKLAKEKVVFVFGKVLRTTETEEPGPTNYDPSTEASALWELIQQVVHEARMQSWSYRPQLIDVHGSGEPDASARGSAAGELWKNGMKALCCDRQVREAIFATCDSAGEGVVDWETFVSFAERSATLLNLSSHWTESLAEGIFKAADVDGDGVLNAQEWNTFFKPSVQSGRWTTLMDKRLCRVLTDRSFLSIRTGTTVRGEVDLGIACGQGHAIRPLRLKSWGDDIAKKWFLGAGFRCAEMDDQIAYAATLNQRCTRCNYFDSKATFLVACEGCGPAFGVGWWCTPCVMEAGVPCDCLGPVKARRSMPSERSCDRCDSQPCIVWCPNEQSTAEERTHSASRCLCGEHGADLLLEDAARVSATFAREASEGKCLAVTVRLWLKQFAPETSEERAVHATVSNTSGLSGIGGEKAVPSRWDEELAQALEKDLFDVLSLEGVPPNSRQLEVVELRPDGADYSLVEVTIVREFGRPSPFELYLRLRSAAVDRDGPLYSPHRKALSSLSSKPALVEVLVCDEPEHADLTQRILSIISMHRPILPSHHPSVNLWPRVVQPRAAALTLQCNKSTQTKGGRLVAYVLAYPVGSRQTAPAYHEFVHFLEPSALTAGAPSTTSAAAAKVPGQGYRSSSNATETKRPPQGTQNGGRNSSKKSQRSNSTSSTTAPSINAAVDARQKQRGGANGKSGGQGYCQPDSGTIVQLRKGPQDQKDWLFADLALQGLQPNVSYDVFVAILETGDPAAASPEEPLIALHHALRTPPEASLSIFGSDETGILELQTEQSRFKREHCLLDLLGLSGIPCVLDAPSCQLSSKALPQTATKDAEKAAREALKEHSLTINLEPPDVDATGDSGAIRLPIAVLSAEPSYREGDIEMEVTISADIAVHECEDHQTGLLPQCPLGVSGAQHNLPYVSGARYESTPTRISMLKRRCPNCRWAKMSRSHKVRVRVTVNLARMAELAEWKSVQKRLAIVNPMDARAAVPAVLAARPRLKLDMIMLVFEAGTGHGAEVDFAVRSDGASALHVAVEEGNMPAVRQLLRRRLDPFHTNNAGETPLHSTARGGGVAAPRIADCLLGSAKTTWRGSDRMAGSLEATRVVLLNKQDHAGRTALHIAVAADQPALVKVLLDAKADATLEDQSGCNAFQASIAANSYFSAMTLLQAPGITINGPTSSERGCTPLMLAAERCNAGLALSLLQKKADPTEVAECEGGRPRLALNFLLEGAVRGINLGDLRDFVHLGRQLSLHSDASREQIAMAGATVCEIAMSPTADGRVIGACEILLKELGALAQAQDPNWASTLGSAMLRAVQRITALGHGDRNDDDRVVQAQTPAAYVSNLSEVVAFALRSGANPNAVTPDENGESPLTMLYRYPLLHRVLPNDRAAGSSIARTIQCLLKYKADLNLTNRKGETAHHLATQLFDNGDLYGESWRELIVEDCPPPAHRSPRDPPPPSEPGPTKVRGQSPTPPQRAPVNVSRTSSQAALPALPVSLGQQVAHRNSSSSLVSTGAGITTIETPPPILSPGRPGSRGGAGQHFSARTAGQVTLPSLLPTLSGSTSPASLKRTPNARRL